MGSAQASGIGAELLEAIAGDIPSSGDTASAASRSTVSAGAGADSSYAFPDIFGAASSWLGGTGASIANTAYDALRGRVGPSRQRLQVDAEVSRQMAEFWVTFAAYGDPNGRPADHSSGEMNGYVPGSRADRMPWWPRLMGDIVRAAAASEPGAPQADEDSGSSYVDEASESVDGAGMEGTDGDDATDAEEKSTAQEPVTIRATIGRTSEEWGEALLRPIRHRSAPITLGNIGTKHQDNPHTAQQPSPRAALREPSSSASALQLFQERQQEQRLLAVAAAQYVHQMVFDEETSVNIIENDCICSAWNEMEYRF